MDSSAVRWWIHVLEVTWDVVFGQGRGFLPKSNDGSRRVVKDSPVERGRLPLDMHPCAHRCPSSAWPVEAVSLRHGLCSPASAAEGNWPEFEALVPLSDGWWLS